MGADDLELRAGMHDPVEKAPDDDTGCAQGKNSEPCEQGGSAWAAHGCWGDLALRGRVGGHELKDADRAVSGEPPEGGLWPPQRGGNPPPLGGF